MSDSAADRTGMTADLTDADITNPGNTTTNISVHSGKSGVMQGKVKKSAKPKLSVKEKKERSVRMFIAYLKMPISYTRCLFGCELY